MISVTYCCESKNPISSGTPGELYKSIRIKAFFKYFPGKKAILSYKYGIVAENQVIDNYNQNHFTNIEMAAKNVAAYVNGELVVFYSPRPLTEGPWIRLLTLAGVKFRIARSARNQKLQPNLRNYMT